MGAFVVMRALVSEGKRCWRCEGTGDANHDDGQVIWRECPVCKGAGIVALDYVRPVRVFRFRSGETHYFPDGTTRFFPNGGLR